MAVPKAEAWGIEPGYHDIAGDWRTPTPEAEAALLAAMGAASAEPDAIRAPLVVTYGTYETPDFQRQSRDFAAAVKGAGKPVELIEAPNYNHFEIAESLGHPYGPNGRAALKMMKLSVG